MTLSELFKNLGAPLANIRWSWGAERPADGAIFLRVWQDECRKIDGKRCVRVTEKGFSESEEVSLGYAERLRHIDKIKGGTPAYLIMCIAVDAGAAPRTIAKFDRDQIFVGGALIEDDGDWWIKLVDRQPISAIRGQQ